MPGALHAWEALNRPYVQIDASSGMKLIRRRIIVRRPFLSVSGGPNTKNWLSHFLLGDIDVLYRHDHVPPALLLTWMDLINNNNGIFLTRLVEDLLCTR